MVHFCIVWSSKTWFLVDLFTFCLLGMAIFDTMRHIRPDVSTVCVGLAARYHIL